MPTLLAVDRCRRTSCRRLPVLLAGLSLLLGLGWFTFLPPDASVTSDDGAYALEVIALEENDRWSVPHVLAPVDEQGLAYPYANASATSEGWFPGARHAVWVQALRSGHRIGGAFGMHAVAFAGLAVAAASSAAICVQVGRHDDALLAGVLVIGSPLLFQSLQLWGHAAVTAGIALLVLSSLKILQGVGRWPAVLVGAVSAAAASAIRGDGLVFAIATGVVLLMVGAWRRQRRPVVIGATFCAAALGGYWVATTYADRIIGTGGVPTVRAGGGDTSMATRVGGLLQTFLSEADAPGAFVLLFAAVGLTAAAVVAHTRSTGLNATVLLTFAAILWVARMVVYPSDVATGLVGAWPVLLFGVLRPWRTLNESERHLVLMIVIGFGGIALAQYPQGAGLNWGGRFVSAALPALAVLTATGVSGAVRQRKRLAPAIGALVACTAMAALLADASLRTQHDRIVDEVEDASAPVVTAEPALPRLAWRTYPEVEWLLVPAKGTTDGSQALAELLQEARITTVVVFGVPEASASKIGRLPESFDASTPIEVVRR